MSANPRAEWLSAAIADGAATTTVGDATLVDAFSDWRGEYASATRGAAILDRADRGLLRVTGKDRTNWLHNLVTNQVKTLAPSDGQYAFAINIKGRILFDLYIMVLSDEMRLDIDRRWLSAALKHFNKYIITEDVRLADASSEFDRLSLIGPRSGALLAAMGLTQAENLPLLQSTTWRWQGRDIFVIRTDGFGVRAFDLMFPPQARTPLVEALTHQAGAAPAVWAGRRAAEALRIEAGIPAPFSELNDDVLPAETGQLARAVSFNKGCYLGQEIVERMRSRHALARVLMGVVADDAPRCDSQVDHTPSDLAPAQTAALSAGDTLVDDAGQNVGRITSVGPSPAMSRTIGLALVKTTHARAGTRLRLDSRAAAGACGVVMADLPLVRHASADH